MNISTKRLTALGLIVTLGLAAAPGAFAKGHDQGSTETPGQDVGEETVSSAQDLGAGQRSDSAPDKETRDSSPGKSDSAGRD